MTDQPRPLVAVLEDDPRSAAAMQMLLQDWGFASLLGAELDELLQRLAGREHEVRAIVTDFQLRGGPDGVGAIARLRGVGVDAPALVLTGTVKGRARRAASAAGHAFIEKPAQPARLRAWLSEAIAAPAR